MQTAYLATPLGIAAIIGDEDGISSIKVIDEAVSPSVDIDPVLADAVLQISEYFSGTRTQFTFLTNPSGTEFQKKVWDELRQIPHGTTTSYFELSKKLGNIKAIRAVASANGKNPLWIIVPCHRVIGTDGSLTGYAGGLWRKKWLLEHESASQQHSLF
ncbi:MAG TPA: methylated-DNA--[protein]-cysteine S-methyltransferase [Flavobacterium sp.]|jgi:methylated-DNA-[protein]-cysteine S-methyltransferase